MPTSTPTQSTPSSSSVPAPQTIQIQIPSDGFRLPASTPPEQSDMGTFAVIIGLVILAKTLLGTSSSK
ncbi:hypothetical protein H6F43_03585 [Leptolyngbya sp. FACHB-36]|uniref:hypothetical protein n=1 Tax=Leptolyngbya sp. FACHB-36 TaxID=2692808 RepID=UPI001680159B|nr:hypothetical protein [Leptolyngbya sp. FACHB-36]MBD2019264.1 hypothetical protein [Leptolyngbya sp. FACHB-36]